MAGRREPIRLFSALLASAATATLLVMLIEMLTTYPPPRNAFSWATIALFAIGLTGTMILAAALGLPAYLVAKRFGQANARASAIAGLAIGCFVSFLVLTVVPILLADPDGPSPTPPISEAVWSYIRYGAVGLVSGVVFWFVLGRNRRKTPPPDVF